jgi:hypothetical protein
MKKFKGNLKHFSKPCKTENSRVRWVTFKDGDVVPEEWEDAVLKQGGKLSGKPLDVQIKPKEKSESNDDGLSEEAKKKLEDVKEDLKDDGKLNHSNDPKKKSPGRKKKVKKKAKK